MDNDKNHLAGFLGELAFISTSIGSMGAVLSATMENFKNNFLLKAKMGTIS